MLTFLNFFFFFFFFGLVDSAWLTLDYIWFHFWNNQCSVKGKVTLWL